MLFWWNIRVNVYAIEFGITSMVSFSNITLKYMFQYISNRQHLPLPRPPAGYSKPVEFSSSAPVLWRKAHAPMPPLESDLNDLFVFGKLYCIVYCVTKEYLFRNEPYAPERFAAVECFVR